MMRRVTEGSSEPLGLTLTETGANVAVFSAHAQAIELCLFDAVGEKEVERIRLAHRTGDVFHAHAEGIDEGRRYGFRAHGPYEPENGDRFNAAKLLLDPYALQLDRPFKPHPSLFGYVQGGPEADLSLDRSDSGPFMPKGVAVRPKRADTALRPRHAWADTLIYELHVKGFTQTHPAVPPEIRGTFAGLAHEAALAHLVGLGVTAVEIMPCAAFIDEPHLARLGLTNYWGYNPVAMMAPDPRLAPGGWDEVRDAVAQLHRAGVEVILDVVFNHTGEGDEFGPTLSLRGLDNASYYRLRPDAPRHYVNDSGCGNILRMERPQLVRYALDALRAFAEYGGVDGFRFDLATTLARRPEGFDPQAPFLSAILQDPALRELKLIAEPWDVGPGGYQLGRFPAPFGEWNDRFRDCLRRFWRGDATGVGELATRVAGSQDIFGPRYRPSRSVNFITAHDGFTLRDLVSFTQKRNEANGEDNRDGTDQNFSWNCGVEGETEDAAIRAVRAKDQRNLLLSLFLARGTPMLSMGAEMGQTQGGVNNAYAQDNQIAWLDWESADRELLEFTRQAIALRKTAPALTRDTFLQGAPLDETLLPDIEWRRADGAPMQEEDWRAGEAATLVAALYAPGDRIMIVWHRGDRAARIATPAPQPGCCWVVALATAKAELTQDGLRVVPPRCVVALRETTAQARHFPSPAPREVLQALAQAAGVAPQWRDATGVERQVPQQTMEMLLARLELPAQNAEEARESLALLARREDRRALPMSALFRDGEEILLRIPAPVGGASFRIVLALEDGDRREIDLGGGALTPVSWRGIDGRRYDGFRARLPRLPLGRHVVSLDGVACRLTIAPRCCFAPEHGRCFGVAAQLYSVRREGDQGIGDFTTLSQLSACAAKHGAATLALNPLHALFAQDRERASPYYPSDRMFLDPIYLDIARLADGFAPAPEELARLHGADYVDYPGVWAVKRRVLEQSFAAFDDFTRRQPSARDVQDFSRFVAAGGRCAGKFRLFRGAQRTARRGRLAALAAAAAGERRGRAAGVLRRQWDPPALPQISAVAVRMAIGAGRAERGRGWFEARLLPRSRRGRGAGRRRKLAQRRAAHRRFYDRRAARRLLARGPGLGPAAAGSLVVAGGGLRALR